MNGRKLLVIDDEEDILELLTYNLQKEGFDVVGAMTGEDALKLATRDEFDLVLLDLMLPGIDGLEVAKRLKADIKTKHVPIIMLTAKGEEPDVVLGLEMGAEDYITKPFSVRILVARVRTALRRKATEQPHPLSTIHIKDLLIDIPKHKVSICGNDVDLTHTEFEVLALLARRPGWVFSRSKIVDSVKGSYYSVTDRSVDVQIVGLRKKLGPCGKYIETVRGVGYRFKELS